jgi:hypothetical protein
LIEKDLDSALAEGKKMSNNEPDYKDNLVFEPKLTWEELCDKYNNDDNDNFSIHKYLSREVRMSFWHDGDVYIHYGNGSVETGFRIAENKTPAQMQAIITALWGE